MRTNFVLLKTRETKTQNQKHLAKTFNCSYKKNVTCQLSVS